MAIKTTYTEIETEKIVQVNVCLKPCFNCPFKKSTLPWWGGVQALDHLEGLQNPKMVEICIFSHYGGDGFSKDGRRSHTNRGRLLTMCAGAILAARHLGLPKRHDRMEIKMIPGIVKSPQDIVHRFACSQQEFEENYSVNYIRMRLKAFRSRAVRSDQSTGASPVRLGASS